MKIVVVDYGIGNVQSIFNALSKFKDVDVILSDSQDEIMSADGLILPGVGAFKRAMKELKRRNLPNVLGSYILQGKPFLGICLGMQLLFESSEEFGYTDNDIHMLISSYGFKPISYNPKKREVYEINSPKEFGNTIYVKNVDQVINLCIEAENVLIHSAFNKVI